MNNNIINSAQQSKTNAYHLIDGCKVLMTMSEDASVEYIVNDVKSMLWTYYIDQWTKVLVIVPNNQYAEIYAHQFGTYGFYTDVIEKQDCLSEITHYNDDEVSYIYNASYLIEAINEFSNRKSKKRKAKLKKIIRKIFNVEEMHIKKCAEASTKQEVFNLNNLTDLERFANEFYKAVLVIVKLNISPKDSQTLLKSILEINHALSYDSEEYTAQIIKHFLTSLDFETWEDVDVASIRMHMVSPRISIASFDAIEGRSEYEQSIDRIYFLPFGNDNSTQEKNLKSYRDIDDLIDSCGALVTYIL